MNWLTRLSAWTESNPRAADFVLFLGAFALALRSLGDHSPDDRPVTAMTIVVLFAGSVPVLWRRFTPIMALATSSIITYGYWIYDYPGGGTWPAMAVLVVSMALEIGSRRVYLRTALVFLVLTTGVLVAGLLADSESEVTLSLIATNIIIYTTVVLLGDSLRNRRARLRALEEEAAQARREQQQLTERAVADERTRIARELHDVVAHSMSVMVVQAEAARRVVGRNDEQAKEALGAIADGGRESLADMRRLLGVLREGDETSYAPAPDISGIDALAEHCRAAGLPVEIEVTGEARDLPTSVQLSLYRIIQESLTNSLRHAGKAKARIELDYNDDGVDLAITDDGRGAATEVASEASASPTPGHGLIGMHERVETYGGAFSAGPRLGGGFEVQAHIPIGAS